MHTNDSTTWAHVRQRNLKLHFHIENVFKCFQSSLRWWNLENNNDQRVVTFLLLLSVILPIFTPFNCLKYVFSLIPTCNTFLFQGLIESSKAVEIAEKICEQQGDDEELVTMTTVVT